MPKTVNNYLVAALVILTVVVAAWWSSQRGSVTVVEREAPVDARSIETRMRDTVRRMAAVRQVANPPLPIARPPRQLIVETADWPKMVRRGDTIYTRFEYPAGPDARWSSGPFIAIKKSELKGFIVVVDYAGQLAEIDAFYIDWKRSHQSEAVLYSEEKITQ